MHGPWDRTMDSLVHTLSWTTRNCIVYPPTQTSVLIRAILLHRARLHYMETYDLDQDKLYHQINIYVGIKSINFGTGTKDFIV